MSSSTSTSLPNNNNDITINIRSFEERDSATVTRIWVDGLEQTVQAASLFTRPLWRRLMMNLANQATSIDGDMGPNGINLNKVWGNNNNENDDRIMFVAERNDGITNEIIGVCCIKRGEHENDIPPTGYPIYSIWRMSVDDRVRRCKVGSLLMLKAEEWAKSKGGKKITLMTGNSMASKFYQSLGYKTIGIWKIRHEKELIIRNTYMLPDKLNR